MLNIGGRPGGAAVDPEQVKQIVSPLVNPAAETAAAAKVDDFSTGVASVAALRTRSPRFNGERIYLKQYRAPAVATMAPVGGGFFVGYTSATGVTDDGGVRIKGPTGHWVREKEIPELIAFDFGAMGDGVSDDGPAIQAMYEFTIGKYASDRTKDRARKLGVRLGAGTHYVTPRTMNTYGTVLTEASNQYPYYPDVNGVRYEAYNDFLLRGADCDYGTQILTRIISDKSDKPVFSINHRRFTVKGIEWDGQQTTKFDEPSGRLIGASPNVFNDTASNKQPFLINYCAGGTYGYVTHFSARNTGSYAIYYFDSLDSIFDQMYTGNTAGPVLQVGWTNREPGGWNHSTAIQITNCNFQQPCAPAIWAPRATQCLMRNVWFEHGDVAFDINNGHWILDAVSCEGFRKPAQMWQCRTIRNQWSNPVGAAMDYDTKPTDAGWGSYLKNPDGSDITPMVSGFELGKVEIQNYGAYFDCPVRAGFFSGSLNGTLNATTDEYVNIGNIQLPDIGTHVHIEIMSRNEFGSQGVTTTALNAISDRTNGLTRIKISRASANEASISWHSEGAGGVLDVRAEITTFVGVVPALWVKFKATVGTFAMFAYSSGTTRKESGSWAQLTWSGARSTATPANTRVIDGMWSSHNGKAGFGFRNDVVSITSRSTTHSKAAPLQNLADFTKPFKTQLMVINGEELYVPTYAPQPIITTQPAGTATTATGGSFALTVAATYAARYLWQKSTDNGTTWVDIANSNLATYTKSSVVAGDAGMYRVIVKGKLENADDTVTTNRVISTSTTVTVS